MKQLMCAVRRNLARFCPRPIRTAKSTCGVAHIKCSVQQKFRSRARSRIASYSIPCSVQSYVRNNFVLWQCYITCKERNWLTGNTMARKWLKHKRTAVIFPPIFLQIATISVQSEFQLFAKKISVCITFIYITIYTNRYKMMYSLLIMKTVLQIRFLTLCST